MIRFRIMWCGSELGVFCDEMLPRVGDILSLAELDGSRTSYIVREVVHHYDIGGASEDIRTVRVSRAA